MYTFYDLTIECIHSTTFYILYNIYIYCLGCIFCLCFVFVLFPNFFETCDGLRTDFDNVLKLNILRYATTVTFSQSISSELMGQF